MEIFIDTLEDCQLCELGFREPKFTWNNQQSDRTFIKERLDRTVATKEWCKAHIAVEVDVMAARSLDHKPLFVNFSNKQLGSR